MSLTVLLLASHRVCAGGMCPGHIGGTRVTCTRHPTTLCHTLSLVDPNPQALPAPLPASLPGPTCPTTRGSAVHVSQCPICACPTQDLPRGQHYSAPLSPTRCPSSPWSPPWLTLGDPPAGLAGAWYGSHRCTKLSQVAEGSCSCLLYLAGARQCLCDLKSM